MEFFNHILGFLSENEFSVPASQVSLLIFMNSFCLLMGKHKLGLLVSYTFVFYWGFIFNRVHFVTLLGETTIGLYLYAIFGLFMLFTILFGFLRGSD